MDILEIYLTQHRKYNSKELIDILETKINITKNHVKHIKCTWIIFEVLTLFEKYGYIFTEDDYKYIVGKYPFILERIPDDNKTYEICKIAVQKYGSMIQYISDDKKTDEICKIAVEQCNEALKYVPNEIKIKLFQNIKIE